MNRSVSLNRKITNLILASLNWQETRIVSRQERTAVPMFVTRPSLNQLGINKRAIEPNRTNVTEGFTGAVGIFSHYRDAIVAALDLKEMGLPMTWITLIARDCKRYEWMSGLTICDRFNESFWGLSEESERFLYRRFNRGKYLVKVEGTDDALRCAKEILNRRRNSEI